MAAWAVTMWAAGVALAPGVFGFFRRKRRVPEWAAFFTPERFDLFNQKVAEYWTRRGFKAEVDGQRVVVAGDSESGGEFGLSNLAQICNQIDPGNWNEAIAGHFDSLARSKDEARELEGKIDQFEAVRHLLAVRIGTYDLPRDLIVWREDLPGTVSYLCLDLPSSVQTVNPDHVAQWGVPVDELFAIGLENVRRECVPELVRDELEPGVPYLALTGQSFFVATHALMLRRWDGFVGRAGALVAIPHRHAVICHPIEDIRTVKAVHRLALIARGMEQEGPGSITPDIYWYHDDRFTPIPYEVTGEKFILRPPDEFVELLNRLAGEGGE